MATTDVQGWRFDYEGVYAPTMWADPVEVATMLSMDPNDADQLAEVADLVAEASGTLDQYTGRRYGPARCMAATYRLRAGGTWASTIPHVGGIGIESTPSLLNLTPPAATIVKVILHHESCYPNQPVPLIDEQTPETLMGRPLAPDLEYSRSLVAQLAQAGDRVGPMAPPGIFPLDPVPGPCSSTSPYGWCLDSSRMLRLCGMNRVKNFSCGPYCGGNASELITVFYRSQENWPPGMRRALLDLIRGLAAGNPACTLPPKTTSVQRQGVSWTVEESDGVTGVASTDRWLQRHRPGLRLKDPLRATLTQAQYLPCEAFYPFYPADQYYPLGDEFAGELLPDAVPSDPLGLLECTDPGVTP